MSFAQAQFQKCYTEQKLLKFAIVLQNRALWSNLAPGIGGHPLWCLLRKFPQNFGWRELCQAAIREQDPKKSLALIAEVSRILEDEECRLVRAICETPTE